MGKSNEILFLLLSTFFYQEFAQNLISCLLFSQVICFYLKWKQSNNRKEKAKRKLPSKREGLVEKAELPLKQTTNNSPIFFFSFSFLIERVSIPWSIAAEGMNSELWMSLLRR
jgi:hypothetical protein